LLNLKQVLKLQAGTGKDVTLIATQKQVLLEQGRTMVSIRRQTSGRAQIVSSNEFPLCTPPADSMLCYDWTIRPTPCTMLAQ
jgi:hypothetical protein